MHRYLASRLLWLALILAAAGACMSACGQKGPLYLPDEAPQDNG